MPHVGGPSSCTIEFPHPWGSLAQAIQDTLAAQPCAGKLGHSHLLYDSVSFSKISEAFLVEFSMADILEACSLQLFSWIAL